jgi:glycerophosphoryl diester phosphodiesterase
MIAIYIILGIIVLLCGLYLTVFIRPQAKSPENKRLLRAYAHRGLHGKEIPENSIAAFKAAIDKGYGIELDVQLSLDGTVMVFHDYDLSRMTGVDKKLCNLSENELKTLSLACSDQHIPTFEEVLALVNGAVPLLVELKGETLDASLCPKVAQLLENYKGDYCIESFNPLLLKEMRKYLPKAYYGQLYTNVCRDKKKHSVLNILLVCMVFNFLARPNFIAYNKKDRNSLPVKITTKLYKSPKFVWTVKNREEIDLAKQKGEYPIFELE